jgi:hypothetical protein
MSVSMLEQRIATALADDDIASGDLDLLIQEVEVAASAADKAVQQERERALDPSLVVDAVKARETVVAAEFLAQRLRKALPQLRARLQQVHLHERYSQWLAEFDRVKPKHGAAAARLRVVYLEFESKLVEALYEAQEVDAEVKHLMNVKPCDAPEANGDGCYLLTVEMAARGITGIGRHGLSIMKDLTLPDFSEPTKLAWPPPTVPLAVQIATSAIHGPHPGANWWQVAEEEARRAVRERQREAAEEEAKQRELWRGPRWWEGERA